MNEISFQAVQFLPRFVAFVALLAGTWLISRFAKNLVLRTTCKNHEHLKRAKALATVAAGSVFVVMLPFMLNAAGFGSQGLYKIQQIVAQVFVNWPLMMVLSLVVAGIAYLVREVPRFCVQVKGTFGTSHREV